MTTQETTMTPNRFPTIPAGTLAVITHNQAGPTNPNDPTPAPGPCVCRAIRQRIGDQWGWETIARSWYGDDTTLVTDARPIAVIDPQHPAEVDALNTALTALGHVDITDTDLAAALTAYAAPAPVNPGEPAAGGPYPDKAGAFWWRRLGPGTPWSCLDVPTREPIEWNQLWDTYGPITLPGGEA